MPTTRSTKVNATEKALVTQPLTTRGASVVSFWRKIGKNGHRRKKRPLPRKNVGRRENVRHFEQKKSRLGKNHRKFGFDIKNRQKNVRQNRQTVATRNTESRERKNVR